MFANGYLSENKADEQNNPSFKSCLLRIPRSINSKYNKQVTIVQKWNGYRPQLTREFLEDFKRYLQRKDRQKQAMMNVIKRNRQNPNYDFTYYQWIEQLLKSPIEDYRKLVIDLILSPYLINVKKLSFEESYKIIKDWLDKCNDIKKLDNYRNFEYRISCALITANKKLILPMSYNTLERYYKDLYILLLQNKKKGEYRLK
jgi:hypothetical protein